MRMSLALRFPLCAALVAVLGGCVYYDVPQVQPMAMPWGQRVTVSCMGDKTMTIDFVPSPRAARVSFDATTVTLPQVDAASDAKFTDGQLHALHQRQPRRARGNRHPRPRPLHGPAKAPVFYGWVVVAATHAVLFVIFGVAYSFAAFFGALEQEFAANRGDVSLVFAISGFLYFMVGAFAGQLADRFGPRRVVAAGIAFLALGLAAAGRADSLEALYVTYSIGIGPRRGLRLRPERRRGPAVVHQRGAGSRPGSRWPGSASGRSSFRSSRWSSSRRSAGGARSISSPRARS